MKKLLFLLLLTIGFTSCTEIETKTAKDNPSIPIQVVTHFEELRYFYSKDTNFKDTVRTFEFKDNSYTYKITKSNIQFQECTEEDLSTLSYILLILTVIIWFILLFSAARL